MVEHPLVEVQKIDQVDHMVQEVDLEEGVDHMLQEVDLEGVDHMLQVGVLEVEGEIVEKVHFLREVY